MAYALSVWASWIAWQDWRKHRIANAALVLVIVPAFLSLAVNQRGLLQTSALDSFFGLVIAAAIMLPGYLMGYTGAGDVKFAGTLGLLMGFLPTLKLLLVFGLFLGVMSAFMWWHHHDQPQILKRRISAAPALSLAFIGQLMAGKLYALL